MISTSAGTPSETLLGIDPVLQAATLANLTDGDSSAGTSADLLGEEAGDEVEPSEDDGEEGREGVSSREDLSDPVGDQEPLGERGYGVPGLSKAGFDDKPAFGSREDDERSIDDDPAMGSGGGGGDGINDELAMGGGGGGGSDMDDEAAIGSDTSEDDVGGGGGITDEQAMGGGGDGINDEPAMGSRSSEDGGGIDDEESAMGQDSKGDGGGGGGVVVARGDREMLLRWGLGTGGGVKPLPGRNDKLEDDDKSDSDQDRRILALKLQQVCVRRMVKDNC